MGHYNSFLIRLWTEEGKEIRGTVQHVGTQESAHFSQWESMLDFMSEHLNWQISEDTNVDKTLPYGTGVMDKL